MYICILVLNALMIIKSYELSSLYLVNVLVANVAGGSDDFSEYSKDGGHRGVIFTVVVSTVSVYQGGHWQQGLHLQGFL